LELDLAFARLVTTQVWRYVQGESTYIRVKEDTGRRSQSKSRSRSRSRSGDRRRI